MREEMIQIVHRKDGKTFPRAQPRTAKYPTENQIKVRILFGKIAKQAKGEKFKVGNKFVKEMPPAAIKVREKMKGAKVGRTRKLKKWEMILMDYGKRTHQYKKVLQLLEVKE